MVTDSLTDSWHQWYSNWTLLMAWLLQINLTLKLSSNLVIMTRRKLYICDRAAASLLCHRVADDLAPKQSLGVTGLGF